MWKEIVVLLAFFCVKTVGDERRKEEQLIICSFVQAQAYTLPSPATTAMSPAVSADAAPLSAAALKTYLSWLKAVGVSVDLLDTALRKSGSNTVDWGQVLRSKQGAKRWKPLVRPVRWSLEEYGPRAALSLAKRLRAVLQDSVTSGNDTQDARDAVSLLSSQFLFTSDDSIFDGDQRHTAADGGGRGTQGN